MTTLEIWLIGIALAMDCLTVSIATGIASRKVLPRPMFLMALAFGVFQGGMLALGFIATEAFSHLIQSVDHWIAFGLLCYLGGQMIYGDLWGDEDETNNAQLLTPRSILTMAVATSIDALAVGVSMACTGSADGLLYPTLVVGFCSWALSIAGLATGIQVGKRIDWHIESIGGLVLIVIGIKILCEHLL